MSRFISLSAVPSGCSPRNPLGQLSAGSGCPGSGPQVLGVDLSRSESGQSFSGLDFQDCSGLFGKPFDRFAADVRVLAMADSASRRWSAAFVYRTSSARLAWPVMAPISCAVQPASARRRAAAFLNPCAEQCGSPALSHYSRRNQWVKVVAANGPPIVVVRRVR
jgi:hypothetical protein